MREAARARAVRRAGVLLAVPRAGAPTPQVRDAEAMQIAGTAALVSGGASGLGLATAVRLAAAGSVVTVLDLPEQPDLPPGLRYRQGDVTDETVVLAAVDAAGAAAPLRIAVTCAGVAPAARTVGKAGPHPLADFARTVSVNLIGTFNVLRLAAAAMSTQTPVNGERGVLVTTASVAAFEGQIGQAAYAASKSGIVGLTLPVARDLAPLLIRIVCIAPGIFDTPLLAGLPEEARRSLGAQVPHPARLGRPDEFAQLVEHIVGNPMINGETIRLDGAIRMAPR